MALKGLNKNWEIWKNSNCFHFFLLKEKGERVLSLPVKFLNLVQATGCFAHFAFCKLDFRTFLTLHVHKKGIT